MKKRYYLLTLIFTSVNVCVFAQQILGWNFSVRPYSKGTETEILANEIDPNLQPSGLSRGKGLNNLKGFNNSFAVGFEKGAMSFEEAKKNDTYIEFNVTPKKGYMINFTTLEFKAKCTNHGGVNYLWTYSINGGKVFEPLGVEALAENSAEGIEQPKLDISKIGEIKDNKKGVVFRLYLWGSERVPSEKSNFAIGRYPLQSSIPSLSISGSVKK